MSVTEDELQALREEAANSRVDDREARAKKAEEVAATTREIKANRLKRELGQGLEGSDEDEVTAPEPAPADPRKLTPPKPKDPKSYPVKAVGTDEDDSDDKSA